MQSPEPDIARRTFFRKLAAGLAMTALGALTAVLASRRTPSAAGETCTNRGICRGCPAFAGCGLPQAVSARQVLGKKGRP
jgi:purine-cytosine permease-like protein